MAKRLNFQTGKFPTCRKSSSFSLEKALEPKQAHKAGSPCLEDSRTLYQQAFLRTLRSQVSDVNIHS